VLDHYLHTISDAQRLIGPRPPMALPPPPPGVTVQPHNDSREALAWLELEQDNLKAAVDFAARTGFDASAWQLAWYLAPALDSRGFSAECLAVAQLGQQAACRLADPVAELQIGRVLGVAMMEVGQRDEAEQLLHGLLARADRHGERVLEARLRSDLAWAAELRGDLPAALTQLEQVVPLQRELGDVRALAACLNGMAYYRAQLGDAEEAVHLAQESLALFERAGSRLWAMHVWDTLGFALHQLGRLEEAAETLQTALDLAREAGNLPEEMTALLHLGDCHQSAGRPELAEECWTQALQLAGERDDPEVQQLRQRLAPA
jgi:tetratricopeptide (TPR) repeat protein